MSPTLLVCLSVRRHERTDRWVRDAADSGETTRRPHQPTTHATRNHHQQLRNTQGPMIDLVR